MSEEFKKDCADAALLAMFPIVMTSLLALEVSVYQLIGEPMDESFGLFISSAIAGVMTACGYLAISVGIRRLSKTNWRFKN